MHDDLLFRELHLHVAADRLHRAGALLGFRARPDALRLQAHLSGLHGLPLLLELADGRPVLPMTAGGPGLDRQLVTLGPDVALGILAVPLEILLGLHLLLLHGLDLGHELGDLVNLRLRLAALLVEGGLFAQRLIFVVADVLSEHRFGQSRGATGLALMCEQLARFAYLAKVVDGVCAVVLFDGALLIRDRFVYARSFLFHLVYNC